MELTYTTLLFLTLMASAGVGCALRSVLHERHVSREAVDSIRLLMGMLLTFSALVLGLLTSSAKERFDGYNAQLSGFSADLIELDHRLRVYGDPAADHIRKLLRSYTAAAIADTWPQEPAPLGEYPQFDHATGSGNVEGKALGAMLYEVDIAIEHLVPIDDFHRQTAARLRDRVATAIQQRWQLIFDASSTISWPFLLVLTSWLAIIFGIFGLTAPRSRLVYTVVMLSALSMASPLYLIIDYSGAFTGALHLSSVSVRSALSHMDQN